MNVFKREILNEDDVDWELYGIKGWLIVFGIALIGSLLFILYSVYAIFYVGIFQDKEFWALVVDATNVDYDPNLKYLLSIEASLNFIMIALTIYVIYLFYAKKFKLKKYFLALSIMVPSFTLLDSFLISFFMDTPMLDYETIRAFIKLGSYYSTWLLYIIYSQRAKNTFIH